MPSNLPGAQALARALSGFQHEFNDVLETLIDRLTAILARYADGDGRIPVQRIPALQAEVRRVTGALFANGQDQVFGADGVTPQADYPRLLNKWLVLATLGAIEGHASFMKRRAPDDVLNFLALVPSGNPSPAIVPFRPNPLAFFEHTHLWEDSRGYTLSTRVWNAGVETIRDLNGLMERGIRQGRGALSIARDLEPFLLPGRKGLLTNKPYGSTKASYDAMRLARTEITRANGVATLTASAANPFVEGVDWKLSISHPRQDVCDLLATLGMSGERLREPYLLDTMPSYPPHPHCLCVLLAALLEDIQSVIAQLRQYMAEHGTPPYVTPANVRAFLIALLGVELVHQIGIELGV